MITEDFTTPLIVKVDGVWRPVMGKVLEEITEKKSYPRLWVSFILNGKVLEERSSRCWRNFTQDTAFSKIKQLAIKYNIIDMDDEIRSRNTAERYAKEDKLHAQREPRPVINDEQPIRAPRFRRVVFQP